MPYLGAHLSAAGGAWRAATAARDAGCQALQLFLRPPSRWAAAPLQAPQVRRFHAACAGASLVGRCFAHAPYLLNLASANAELRDRSIAVMADELRRAGNLGLAGVVLHPGSGGTGVRGEAESRCSEALVETVERAGDRAARLLLEGMAGAGGQLGRTPAELARLVAPSLHGKVGVCLDTAHLWAAGYDLLADGWERVLGELADHWGAVAPHLLHANDTRVELGSHRDRHAPPGGGRLGEAFFRRMLDDERCAELAVVLEIPPGVDNKLVKAALRRLRRWHG